MSDIPKGSVENKKISEVDPGIQKGYSLQYTAVKIDESHPSEGVS